MLFSTVWAYLMPNVTNSVYFHNEKPKTTDETPPPVKNHTSSPDEPKTTENIESQPSKTKVGNTIEYRTLYIDIYYIVGKFTLQIPHHSFRRLQSHLHITINGYLLPMLFLMIILKK